MTSPATTLAAADWQAVVAKVLDGADPDSLAWHTTDDIAIKPLYPAHDGAGALTARSAQLWHIAQRVDHPDLAEANRLALADLEGGADALALVHADAPTARGFGLQLRSAEDLGAVLAGVALDAIELRFDPGPHGGDLAEAIADIAVRRGHAAADLRLDLGIDPVTMLATTGALQIAWPDVCAAVVNSVANVAREGSASAVLRADGRAWSAAGASEVQELAAVLSAGVLYLRGLEARGIAPDVARTALSFALTADADINLTIAKFRALRRLWAGIEEGCGLAPRPIRLHGETSWRMMITMSPHTNLVRGTVACFAAAVGGADGVTVLPFTLPLGLPDGFARRLARNTQHVLAAEANLWRVADPAAGAGLFETLTDALCDKAWALFREIERDGGIVESLVSGRIQKRIAAVRRERETRLADGLDALVGVSIFAADDDVSPAILIPTPPHRSPVASGALQAETLPSHRASEPFETGSGRAKVRS